MSVGINKQAERSLTNPWGICGSDPSEFRWSGTRGNWNLVQYYMRHCGLNVMPICTDHSRKPKILWGRYQIERVPRAVIDRFFGYDAAPSGIGVICGDTSGGLELADFDRIETFAPWIDLIPRTLVTRLVYVRTPKGMHVYFRSEAFGRSDHLAMTADNKVKIETRGQGGYAVLPGSPPATHKSLREYRLHAGDFSKIPLISADEREILLAAARTFDEAPPKREFKRPATLEGWEGSPRTDCLETRPGDDYNLRASWYDILEPAGWTPLRESGDVQYWSRPDKSELTVSASTGHCGDRLYVFSSNAFPFESETSYTKFAAYALLNYGGDFSAAGKSLADKGFGKTLTVTDINEFVKSY